MDVTCFSSSVLRLPSLGSSGTSLDICVIALFSLILLHVVPLLQRGSSVSPESFGKLRLPSRNIPVSDSAVGRFETFPRRTAASVVRITAPSSYLYISDQSEAPLSYYPTHVRQEVVRSPPSGWKYPSEKIDFSMADAVRFNLEQNKVAEMRFDSEEQEHHVQRLPLEQIFSLPAVREENTSVGHNHLHSLVEDH